MKLKRIFFIIFSLLILTTIAGCKNNQIDYSNKIKVVYMLEGGSYQNCTAPIVQYYDKSTSGSLLIHAPTELSSAQVVRNGYEFEGWYQVDGAGSENMVYKKEWNFRNDRLVEDELTLYAKWSKKSNYTYTVCYYDENGQVVELGKYTTSQGSAFSDSRNFKNKRIGYTAIGYLDENGNPWDPNFVHPGGSEDNVDIKVFVEYIEGVYEVVTTAKELKASVGKNIYLANDIDMQGDTLNFKDYKNHIFKGNNHTISNFVLSYSTIFDEWKDDFEDESKRRLDISLFGNMESSTIEDVTFEDVHIKIDITLSKQYRIYVAGICISMKNSVLKNVKFSGDCTIVKLPNNFNREEDLMIVSDGMYYLKDEASTITDSQGSIEIK